MVPEISKRGCLFIDWESSLDVMRMIEEVESLHLTQRTALSNTFANGPQMG